MEGPRRIHSEGTYWGSRERACNTWWYSRCVIGEDGKDELSVPCAMFDRCMYASKRESYSADELAVLDAWTQAHVCLIGYSERWRPDTSSPREWEKL